MKVNNLLLDRTQIRNFLSIRYNPLDKPIRKPITYNALLEKNSDSNGEQTEEYLRKSALNLVPKNTKTIAISLSSGIDSSLCLAILRKSFPNKKIVAICAVFDDGFDESKLAKKTAEKFEANFKILHMKSLFSHMPEIVYVSGKPRWNTYTHLVAKESKKYSDIFVTGDGADELFGGYTFRYSKFLVLHKSSDGWKKRVQNYLECHNRDWVPDQHNLFGKSIKFNWEHLYRYFKPYFQNELSPLQQVMLADFNGKLLFDFIPTGKSICKYYGLRSAPLFQDPRLMSFALHIPLEQKFDLTTQTGKLILRKICMRLGIIHAQDKKGFSPSLLFDWKKYGKDICKNYILNKNANIFRENLINYDWVLKAFTKIDDDDDIRYLNRLIAILALEIWYRLFVSKEMHKTDILT